MRDYLFKAGNEAGDVDRTKLKKAIADHLGDRVVGDRTRYQFSAEPLADLGPWFRLRLVDVELPETLLQSVREVPVLVPRNGDRVLLRAWAALDRNMFKSKSDGLTLAERCRRRLGLFSETLEQAAAIESFDVEQNIGVAEMCSKGTKLARPFGRITALGVVREEGRLREFMAKGIGEARAYGFGLVAARRAL